MKLACLALLFCAGLCAQNLQIRYTTDVESGNANQALSSTYSFADTSVSDSSTILINIVNKEATAVEILPVLCTGPSSLTCGTPNSDFTLNASTFKTLAPGGNYPFTLHFTPTNTGPKDAYLQVFFTTKYSPLLVSHLSGQGTAEQLRLTYNSGAGDVIFFPFRTARLDFSAPVSQTKSITFTLTNETGADITTPDVSIAFGVNSADSNPFAITTPPPDVIHAGGTGTFVVTFSGADVLKVADLVVGSNSYGIQGQGLVVTTIDALELSYYDTTGVINRTPSSVTPISFPQVVPGAAGNTLTFTLANPATSATAITLTALSITGSNFVLSGNSPPPVQIQPGNAITFKITFSAAASGTFTGRLTFSTADGMRSYTLSGLAVVSPVPAMSLHFSKQPLTSGEQVTVTAQAASASTQDAIGTLSMQFTPTIAGAPDDPAILFLSTSSRSLSLDLAKGSQTATYQNQSALTFQTGTTAGTLTFTLNFVNTPPITQTFTITPALIHISSAQAKREDPNLVVTVNGYDNTYSAGKMAFTFYDLKGKRINETPLEVDATSNFHQLFFTNNQAGGAFALQAKFPVTGNITQIGSVAVTFTNSAGETNTNLTFQ